MNRSIYNAARFSLDSLPGWICPTCGKSVLRPDKKTLKNLETRRSKAHRKDEEWEPSWFQGQFSIAFVCADDSCAQEVFCVGASRVEEFTSNSPVGPPQLELREVFLPEFFSFPLNIFEIPKKCPGMIENEILLSFYLFFTDSSGALNHVRSAVELLLTHYQISQFERINHKLHRINLHRRIELFEQINSDVAQKLFAIKWIGNAGSHPKAVKKENVLDAYEILEDVLILLFEKRDLRIRRLVAQVNKRKGPR